MLSKRLILVIGGTFCVLYLMFVSLESSTNYYKDPSQESELQNLSVSKPEDHDDGVKTDASLYPKATPTTPNDHSGSQTSKVAIIINCEGRSGSTWLSSFFWRNPNVFYVYEPLFPSNKNDRAMDDNDMTKRDGRIHQLADTFKCNIDYSKGETLFPMVLGRYPTYQPFLKHCKENGNCPPSLTSYCQSKSHIVQKVIRVTELKDYKALQAELGMPLKIIHLVRDPRPHVISREKLFDYMIAEGGQKYNSLSDAEKSEQRRAFCMRELGNLKVGDSGLFSADNYIRLSHEEMSVEPVKWARKLYEFVGLEFTSETETYLEEITHGKSLVHNGKDPDGRYAGFSVYRDTLTILYKWMDSKAKHVHEIETECKELLDYLNYVPIYDEKLNRINENPWPNVVKDSILSSSIF